MNQKIEQALAKLFDRHRILFWYDAKRELRDAYEAVSLPGVEKLELANNEYGIKYRVLREQPEQKFLLYREGPPPDDLDNWLLDVQLAHGEFRTDQAGIWLSELELGLEFAELVQEHADFFQATKRRDELKQVLKADDSAGLIRLKMLAVCAGCKMDPRVDAILEHLLAELASGEDERIRLVERCNLAGFLWQQLNRHFGYAPDTPSLRDFVLELFKSCYAMGTEGSVRLNGEALVFLKRWKDSRAFEASFEQLSQESAEVLGIERDLLKRDIPELIELDYFELIDRQIIRLLVKAVTDSTVSAGDVALWVRQRRQSHWYQRFSDLYEAIDKGARFLHQLIEADLALDSLAKGVRRYLRSWYQLDQLYRKFIYHMRKSGQVSLLGALAEQVENRYTNAYLLKVNDNWQTFVDAMPAWEVSGIPSQRVFYDQWVRPFMEREHKLCVIISDAMRYEVGEELVGLIRREDRFSAELEAALSMLPSYTQLGMAALLPNRSLALADNDTGTVLVDGQSATGTANRSKILQAALSGPLNKRGCAVTSNELMELDRDASRDLLKANDLVYIYHNRIDHTGDKMHSEGQAFEAAEQALDDLVRLVKKLTNANANNILITADHGFIYQNRTIDESDFSSVEVAGDLILYRDRRFVLGKGLKPQAGLRTFSAEALGLEGEVEVQLPKSINRLRLKGSGSRFVHGGASLQEVIIPVIKINKKRQSDVETVEVDILRGANSVITSGQLAVGFYQVQPVTDKVKGRVLRAGIYTLAGKLISDVHELIFDFASANSRERELQVRFLLSREADEANNQEVVLKLDEKHAGTSHYKDYRTLRYTLRRSITSDFDI
jgi:uncharacterized protein (TIGR02687 family)